jgi:hypothetical protein
MNSHTDKETRRQGDKEWDGRFSLSPLLLVPLSFFLCGSVALWRYIYEDAEKNKGATVVGLL